MQGKSCVELRYAYFDLPSDVAFYYTSLILNFFTFLLIAIKKHLMFQTKPRILGIIRATSFLRDEFYILLSAARIFTILFHFNYVFLIVIS